MSRSLLFADLARLIRIAQYCNDRQRSALEGVERIRAAGEHTNSFYEFQGFMEGAALSGIQAAAEILRTIKRGA